MSHIKFKGKRIINVESNKSVTIFFMSFVYPAGTGYLKRMDLLIRWAEKRFSTINFIFPNRVYISDDMIKEHLKYCNYLFLIDNKPPIFPKIYAVRKIAYKLITGRYPKFESPLFLNKSLGINFGKVVNKYKTDYFLNTRNNFGGLIKYIPDGTISLFDTQDIFTDMHIKYGMQGRSNWLQKILLGYKEKGNFIKSEIENLCKYDKIIAISEIDYLKYYSILSLRNKLVKVYNIGIEPKEKAVSTFTNKEYDCLIVASNFIGTQQGIRWFFNQVTPYLSKPITLCIVGSICDYVVSERLNNINVNIKLQGFVNEIDEYYNKSKIVTLLMLEATGTSVKGMEALAYGAAIISTTTGVRFGGVEKDFHCVITDNPKEFANEIEILIQNQQRRFKLGERALEFAKEKMSVDSAFKLLDSCI